MGLTQPHVTLVLNIILTLTKLWPASLVHHWPLSYMSICVVWLTCHRLYKEVWQYQQHQPVLLFYIYFVWLCNYTRGAISLCIVIPVNNCLLNKNKNPYSSRYFCPYLACCQPELLPIQWITPADRCHSNSKNQLLLLITSHPAPPLLQHHVTEVFKMVAC